MCNIPKPIGSKSEESLEEMQTEESHKQETQTPGDYLIFLTCTCTCMYVCMYVLYVCMHSECFFSYL